MQREPVKCTPAQATRWMLDFVEDVYEVLHGPRHFSSHTHLNEEWHLKLQTYSRARPRFAKAIIYSPGFDIMENSTPAHWEALKTPAVKPELPERENLLWHDSISHSSTFQLCPEVSWGRMERDYFLLSLMLAAASICKSCCNSGLSNARGHNEKEK